MVKIKLLIVGIAILCIGADWPTILKKVKTKYAKFEEEIKDITILQEMKMEQMTQEMKIFKKGKKFRMDAQMHGMKTIVIYDGKETWMIILPMREKRKLSTQEEKYYSQKDWWEWISEKATIVGVEKVNTHDCYVVEIKEKEALYNKIWVDKEKLILVKSEIKGPQEETIQWVNSDFRKIKNEWEMPYKAELYQDGKLVGTFTVKSIEINKNLSDDLFNWFKVEMEEPPMYDIRKETAPQELEKKPEDDQ